MAATIIDGFIVGIPVAIIFNGILGLPRFGYSGLQSVFGVLYAIWLIGASGRTLGMMFCGTRAVSSSSGEMPGYNKSFLRGLVQFVLGITIIGGILDILWPLWDRQNQTLHDKAAGTVVLRK